MSNTNVLVFRDTINKFNTSDSLKALTESSMRRQQVIIQKL